MKRTPSDDLFRLIKSLNKGEKRNFKLLAGVLSREKEKQYLTLFDVIDKQEVYNETKISRQIQDLYGGQLSAAKNYLYRLIVRSLLSYSSGGASELSGMREQVRILVAKDLFDQARKIMRKAVRMAEELEDFAMLHDLLGIELEIVMRTQQDKKLEEKVEEIHARKCEVLEQLRNLDEYSHLGSQTSLLMTTRHVARTSEDLDAFRKISAHPLLKNEANALSTRALITHLTIARKLASYNYDLGEAIRLGIRLVDLYQEAAPIRDGAIHLYFQEMGNLCTYYFRQGQYKEAFETISRFREFRDQFPQARLEYFQLYYVMILAFSIHVGEPERAISQEEEVEQEWSYYKGKIPKSYELWLLYLMAYVHFVAGKPEKALKWINILLAEPRTEFRVDIQCFGRMLNLMIHFELGNFMLVESELPNVQRFLDKLGRLHAFEHQVLKTLRAMVRKVNSPEEGAVMEKLWNEFGMAEEGSFRERAENTLDFKTWLQSRITGKTMARLRQEKIGYSIPQGNPI